MAVNSFEATQGTQTALLTDNTGGTAGTLIPVMKISTDGQGTFTNAGIWGGAVTITSGSINGTVNIGNTPNIGTIGTLGLGTITGNLGTIGTLGLGSVVVNTLPNIPGGSIVITTGTIPTLGTMGTLGLLANGTLTNSGTTTGIGTVSNLGSISTIGTIPAITISAGSLVGTVVNNGGSIQIYDTSGSIVNILTSNGTAVQQNSQLTAGAYLEKSGSVTSGPADIIASIDVSNYKWFSFQIQNTFVGTAQIQFSNDNNTFFQGNYGQIGNSINTFNSNISSNIMGYGPILGRYMKIRNTSFTSGTMQALLELYSFAANPTSLGIVAGQSGIWNIGTMGTLGTINNLGSITNLGQIYNAGTLQAGTVQINQLPTQAITAYGTMGTQGSGTTFFTIQGTVGGGTEVIVSDWSMVVMAGTCGISLSFGTNGGSFVQGTGVIGAGSFPAGGGIAQGVESSLNSGTNGAIYAGLYGNGTAYYHVSYYKATTTV